MYQSMSTNVTLPFNSSSNDDDADEALFNRQIELESFMRTEGLMRLDRATTKAQQRGIESNTCYGKTLLKDYVHRVSLKIDSHLSLIREGRPGSSNNTFRLVKDMEAKTIAYLVLKAIIDRITDMPTLQDVAKYISTALEDEAQYQCFKDNAEAAYTLAMRKQSYLTREYQKKNAMSAMMSAVAEGRYTGKPNPKVAWKAWRLNNKVALGIKLIQLVVEETGLFEVKQTAYKSDGTRSQAGNKHKGKQFQLYRVFPKPELTEWIKDHVHHTGLMSPVYLPCLIPPVPFTNPKDGGYHDPLAVKPIALVKCFNNSSYLDTISTPDIINRMAPCYEAVNTAMTTPWKINTKVLTVLDTMWQEEIKVQCLPPQADLPPPACPKCNQVITDEERLNKSHPCLKDKQVLFNWKRLSLHTHLQNHSAFSKRLIIYKLLWVANIFKDEEAIYFPYQTDFRGRLYAVPQILNPQGSDPAKALLTFAEGKPINDKEASDWLAIHVANTYGNDKLPFAERVQWVHDNTAMIQAIAADPIENRHLWTDTDSPWCFLAACLEWSKFSKQGYGYISHLPIAQDGTCSGLQHYSALLRDEVGGDAVNLTPADKPNDIYRVVAERVIEVLNTRFTDPSSDDYRLAQEWLCAGVINRKLTKRSVMTLPYGSTLWSCKDYIREYVEEVREHSPNLIPWELAQKHVSEGGEGFSEEERLAFNLKAEEEGVNAAMDEVAGDPTNKACTWLAKIVWECIGNTVIAATEAMKWLKDTAKAIACDTEDGLPLAWTTPTGFLVVQHYKKTEERRIKTHLSGALVYSKDKESKTKKTVTISPDTECVRTKTAVDLIMAEETDIIDIQGHRQGIAPNFIHSMDASALVFAVLKARRSYDINSFALIHDSFGTHAADSANLAKAIRESFVQMYQENDVLQQYKDCTYHHLPEKHKALFPIDSMPKRGTLDLKQVLESKYFFS